MNIALLIDGKDVAAAGGATYDRHDPISGTVATRAAAASVADANAAADAAAAAFPAWAATSPNQRRALLLNAAEKLEARTDAFIQAMSAETGSTAPWAGFNVILAAGMLREAASMTTQIGGEVIPSDKPGCFAMAIRQPVGVVPRHRPVERPSDPRRPRHRHAAGLRQHGGAEGLRNLPGYPSADRRGVA
jgi:acyl-CoA reductase-like NAD-dependent aldehyde dehydrogenase